MNIIIILICVLIIFILIVTYTIFRMAFYFPSKRKNDIHNIPGGEQYKQSKDVMLSLIDDLAALPYEQVYITSHDGLRLAAKYYHNQNDAPLEIMFHGYHGMAERDFCGGFKLCMESGHNALLVDQRAHGRSEGRVITFGIKERYDCLDWINYAVKRFGINSRILLIGVSMGAATVLMASDLPLPENVNGIIADCGYTSPRNIIRKVIRDMKLPVALIYPFVRLGAVLFGYFNLEASSAIVSLKSCLVPVLFIHGEDDRFVPCMMSRENFAVCASPKQILTVPGAGHCLCFMKDEPLYTETVKRFLSTCILFKLII